MGTTHLDRRQMLKGLGASALAAGAAATLSPATALADDGGRSVIGAWDFTIHPAQAPDFIGVFNFGQGGVLAEVDAFSPGTPLGMWRHKEGNKFLWKFKGFDFTTSPAGVVVVSGDLALSGNSIQGNFTGTINGTVVLTGTFDGSRMTV
jgi:hypothetical protein